MNQMNQSVSGVKCDRAGRWVKSAVLGVSLAAGMAAVVLPSLMPSAMAQPGGQGGRGGGRGFGGGMGGGAMGMMNAPVITPRQLDSYAQMLNMDSDQKEAARALLDGYAEQTRAINEAMRTKMEAVRDRFRETNDPSVWEGVAEMAQAARAERKAADQQFDADIKSLLTPAQIEKWPKVERAQRRDTTVRRGLISGERVNLFELVDRARLDETAKAAIAPTLEQYDVDLDRALVQRNKVYEASMERMGELRRGGDMGAMQKIIEEGRAASVQVKEVNRKYARQLMGELPEGQREAFDTAFREASFPQVYRKSRAERGLETAAKLDDLTADQKDQLAALTERHAKAASQLRGRMAKAVEDSEMNATIESLFGGGRDQATRDIRNELQEMERGVNASLKTVLTPAQQAKVEKTLAAGDEEDDGGNNDGPRRRGNGQRRGAE